MFDKRASSEFKKILECQKDSVVKCDVKVYRNFIERPIQSYQCLKLTWISSKFLESTISHIQTNKSLKTWTHVDDNDLTSALLLAHTHTHKKTNIKNTRIYVRSFWHERALLLACEMRCYRRTLISYALFSMFPATSMSTQHLYSGENVSSFDL